MLDLWSSDLKFRLDVQTWCSDLSSGLGIFNPRLKIEDWRSSRTLVGESLIQEKIFNLQSGIEDSPGRVPGKSSIFGSSDPKIEDSPGRVPGKSSIFGSSDWRLKILQGESLENLQSSIFNPGLKILQGESLENLQSSIRDWRFSRESPGKSSIFNLGLKIPKPELKSEHQVWTSSLNFKSELHGSSKAFTGSFWRPIYNVFIYGTPSPILWSLKW